MEKIKLFIRTSLIGGVVVILPVVILVAVFRWLFYFITDKIQPLTNLIIARSYLQEFAADLISIVLILLVCFIVGVLVRTKLGGYVYTFFERNLLKRIPSYNLVKQTIFQIMGSQKFPFSSVALVDVFGNDTLATAFITDEHSDGSYTVFVPTGPNPTSGFIFHVRRKNVHKVDVSIEETMRSIISIGLGSNKLIEKYLEMTKELGGGDQVKEERV